MSLFSTQDGLAPADHAVQLLIDYQGILHEALRWRADSLRSFAEGIDRLLDDLERGVEDVILSLASGVLRDEEAQRRELGADDDGQRR